MLLFLSRWRNRIGVWGWWRQGPRPVQLSSYWAPLQSDSLVVCEVDPELKEKLRKFRFRKETDNAAIISECHSPPPYPLTSPSTHPCGRMGGGWGQMRRAGQVSPMDGRGRLTPVCHPSPVKVDKDRQMVVLEEEFQVRGWGGWHPPRSTGWD